MSTRVHMNKLIKIKLCQKEYTAKNISKKTYEKFMLKYKIKIKYRIYVNL